MYNHYYLNSNERKITCTRLVYTGVVKDNPQWFNIPHSHDFFELLYVIQGSGTVKIEGEQYQIKQGDLILVNPNTVHEEKSDTENPIYLAFLAIDNFGIADMKENHLLPENICPVIHLNRYREKIQNLMIDLIHETSSQVEFYEDMSLSLLVNIIVTVQRIFLLNDEEKTGTSQNIKQFIDENFSDEISLDMLAKNLYVSKHHLSHIFKNEFGTSPIKYVIQKRVDVAKDLLLNSDKNIAEIAKIVGYEDLTYFSQIFRKSTGLSPREFRKTH